MNMQCSLIQEFMLYKFELGNNAVKETKNFCVNGEGAVKRTSPIRYLKVDSEALWMLLIGFASMI